MSAPDCPIQEFDVNKFQVDKEDLCDGVSKEFNSYKATKQLKRYQEAKILNLTGGIAMY